MTKWFFRYIMTNIDNCIDESIKAKSLKSDDAKLKGLHWKTNMPASYRNFWILSSDFGGFFIRRGY